MAEENRNNKKVDFRIFIWAIGIIFALFIWVFSGLASVNGDVSHMKADISTIKADVGWIKDYFITNGFKN